MNNQDLIEALYVSYFGRAGDPAGMKFWLAALDSGYSASAAGALFSAHIEAQNQYPLLANPSSVSQAQINSFINSIYQDLFNRDADPGSLDFWQKYLEASLNDSHSVGTFILAVVNAAQSSTAGQDQITMTNKVAAAKFLTESFANASINFNETSSPANTFAHGNIAGVTSDPATVIAAEAEVSAFLHSAIATSLVGVSDAVASSHL